MNKRVLVLSDSLALPRDFPEVCDYDTVWPSLLKKTGYLVHQVSIGGVTSDVLCGQINYHKRFQPDIVIIQVGIVDCAPRFATRFELEFLKRLSILGKGIIRLLKVPFVRKLRGVTYTKPSLFKQKILEIQDLLDVPVYFISIVNATEGYEKKLKGITSKIKAYNQILKDNAKSYIDLSNMPISGIMSDFHHLNSEGHKYIYDRIIEVINV